MQQQGLAVIGCGNLGLSLINGLLCGRGKELYNIHTSKRRPETLHGLAERGVSIHRNNSELTSLCRMLILAVKPYDVPVVLQEIAPFLDPQHHILISVATGVSIADIQAQLPAGVPVFRAMPNTAADVAESITCLAGLQQSPAASDVELLFNCLGESVFIREELMNAATVLGACGVAYVLRFMRSMVQGGIQIGFDAQTATAIVNQLVKGTAQMLAERGTHAEQEIDKVTTPKGCTIVGLNEMEHNGFSSSLIKGVQASFEAIG